MDEPGKLGKAGPEQSNVVTGTLASHKSWCLRFRRPDGRPGKLVLGPVEKALWKHHCGRVNGIIMINHFQHLEL